MTSRGTVALDVSGISKRFPGVVALDDVSVAFERGEVHALVGENGAGKSTLIKILAGRYRPDQGQVRVAGVAVQISDPLAAARLGISVVYQEYNLVPLLTVLDNVLLGREPMRSFWRLDRAAARRRVVDLANLMGVSISLDAYVADLGAAEAKLVEIMKALAAEAQVLILDEPTAALPEKDVAALFAVIRSLRDAGVTVIYISHRLEEIFAVADRVSVLKDGQLVGTWLVAEIDRDTLVRSMVGREIEDVFPPTSDRLAAPIVLRAAGLEDGQGLKGASFVIHEGEIVGIGGMTGNGQRECIRALFGAHRLSGGEVTYRGRRLQLRDPADALRAGIGFIPDDRRNEGLSITQSVLRNLALPSLHLRQTAGVIDAGAERRAGEAIARDLEIRLSGLLQPVETMSGGNQQRVVIGKWLPLEPSVLLFHEPTLGVDVGARAEIYRLMRRLTERGVSIVMVTSDMIELLNVPDRILVFWDGRVSAEFSAGDVTEEAVMRAASGLLQAAGATVAPAGVPA